MKMTRSPGRSLVYEHSPQYQPWIRVSLVHEDNRGVTGPSDGYNLIKHLYNGIETPK